MKAGKKGVFNIALSIFYKVVTIAVGLILPKLFITNYGSTVNGLQASVNQIFTYIALLEAGVGASALQSLFAPAANKDREQENAFISAVSRYYNKIGFIYFAILLAVSGLYALIVPVEGIPWYQVILYIIVSGGLTGLNFFYLGKLKLIIGAEGDEFLVSILSTMIYAVSSAVKILLISFKFNIIFVQLGFLAVNILFTLVYYLIAKKKYPWLSFRQQPDYSCVAQKNSVLIHKVAGLIFQNIDILLLTFLCDLKIVSIYTIYKLVVNMVNSIVATFGDSLNFIFGQKFNTEQDPDKPQYRKLIDTFNVYYSAVAFGLYTVMFLMMIPFVRLYTAKMDIEYVYELLPWLYISIEILTVGREAMMRTIEVAGHFKKTQWRAVAEAAINLGVSVVAILVMKHFFGNIGGLYGALIGTIAAMLYRTTDINIYANTRILHRKAWKPFWCMASNAVCFVAIYLISRWIPMEIHSYLQFFLYAAGVAVVVLPLYFLLQSAFNPRECKIILQALKHKLRKKKQNPVDSNPQ